MPCDAGPSRNERAELKAELDKVTRLLCGLCQLIDNGVPTTHLVVPELAEWWEQHQLKDRERLISGALAKLTFAERKALGWDE